LVGAYAETNTGEFVIGPNQENASYPVGICAERVLLASVGQLYPNMPIKSMAISYHNLNAESNRPLSPCGMCRQALQEYEARVNQPIKLLLSGLEGKVLVIQQSNMLLPLCFKGDDLK
jgi:cytidine deaminase